MNTGDFVRLCVGQCAPVCAYDTSAGGVGSAYSSLMFYPSKFHIYHVFADFWVINNI